MRTAANSMTLGAASAKRCRRLKKLKESCSMRLNSIALRAKSCLARQEPDATKAEAYFERRRTLAAISASH